MALFLMRNNCNYHNLQYNTYLHHIFTKKLQWGSEKVYFFTVVVVVVEFFSLFG